MKDSKFPLFFFFIKHTGRVSKQFPFFGLIHYRTVTETRSFVSLFCFHLRVFKRASQMGPLCRLVFNHGVKN